MNGVRALRLPALSGIGPGLLASLVIAAAAAFLADHYAGPVMLFALLLGMAMNFMSEVDRCKAGISFASRTVLRLGVALLGFRITLWEIAALGWKPVALVVGVESVQSLGEPSHLEPASTLQAPEQPSPGRVFPSSHASAPETKPSPQRAISRQATPGTGHE